MNRGRPSRLPWAAAPLALAAFGCGGDGAVVPRGAPAPAPAVSASIAAGAASVNEWEDGAGVDITVTLQAAAAGDTAVRLRATGSATLGGDFDLVGAGDAELTIPAGERSAAVQLRPIRDLDEEGDETATIAIGAIGGNAPAAGSASSVDVTINDTGGPASAETPSGEGPEGGGAFLLAQLGLSASADTVYVGAVAFNIGSAASSPTTGYLEARTSPGDPAGAVRATPEEVNIGALEPGDDAWEGSFELPLSRLSRSRNHYLAFVVNRTAEEPAEAETDRAFADFHVDADRRVRVRCAGFDRRAGRGGADPLLADQWGLRNTGQTAHSASAGVAGEDLRMDAVLAAGPTGRGVTVAVVDSGMEICHPDLAPNAEENRSFNFVADQWPGARRDDPFLPSLLEGDHGTSVAGIVAMAADNGIGGRGVAPDAGLRGFNLLVLESYAHLGGEYDIDARELDALGMSAADPRSNDVDIFNMSYGGAYGAMKLRTDKRNTFRAGVERLRPGRSGEPLGAIYVLAAGNAFLECPARPDLADERARALFLNAELGCASSNLDPESAWPYVIAVGAFNAEGRRSSYSSAGANLWVVAPGGEDAFEKPAAISTDQLGRDRGYVAQGELELLPGTAAKNPDGDYTYAFGGTSAAAPYAAGAVAVLLEAQPELTWRDVKHVLARTARPLDPDIARTRVAFGGRPAVLQHAWITNAAGYRFHNHYGFGAIALDDAVALARTMTPGSLGAFVQYEAPEQSASAEIPDADGAGVTLTRTVSGRPAGANLEAVQLRFRITHPRPRDLGVSLTSPAGTPSVLNHVFNEVLSEHPLESLDWELLSNAFYGESPNGEWTLNVMDAASGETGQVDSWSLVFFYGDHPEN